MSISILTSLFTTRNAHFVLCRSNKRPIANAWQKQKPPLSAVLNWLKGEGNLVGVIPASIGAICIDVDEGDADDLFAHLSMDHQIAAVKYATRRGHHIWMNYAGDALGNRKWRNDRAYGDIRHAKGFAIIWDIETLGALAATAPPITAAQLAQIFPPPSKQHAPTQQLEDWSEGNRNDTLFRLACRAIRRGANTSPIINRAKQAGLDQDEIDRTLQSAISTVEQQQLSLTEPNKAGMLSILRDWGYWPYFNTRANEIRIFDETNKRHFHLTDGWQANRIQQIEAEYQREGSKGEAKPLTFSDSKFIQCIAAIADDRQVDPFSRMLDEMPDWDGEVRLKWLLAALGGRA